MTSVKYGDWRASITGFKYHYGHGPVAVCGTPRRTYDSRLPLDKCAACVKILSRRTQERKVTDGR
jgi:hypothetical protein